MPAPLKNFSLNLMQYSQHQAVNFDPYILKELKQSDYLVVVVKSDVQRGRSTR